MYSARAFFARAPKFSIATHISRAHFSTSAVYPGPGKRKNLLVYYTRARRNNAVLSFRLETSRARARKIWKRLKGGETARHAHIRLQCGRVTRGSVLKMFDALFGVARYTYVYALKEQTRGRPLVPSVLPGKWLVTRTVSRTKRFVSFHPHTPGNG